MIPEFELRALGQLASARVAVVGDVMLDEFVYGDASRLSPEAPVPVVAVERELDCLGGAANVARNITDLGSRALLLGVVGNDAAGERVRAALESVGIDDRYLVTDPRRRTGIKTRVIARGQHLVRIDHESTDPIETETAAALVRRLEEVAADCSAVILSDYGKGVLTPALLPELYRVIPEDIFVCVDPFPEHATAYRNVNAITPNRDESIRMYRALVDAAGPLPSFERIAADLRRTIDCQEVYVTLGAEGMVYAADTATTHFPTRPRTVFDVSGAGDTVIAVVAGLRGLGVEPATVAALANRAAGIVVEKLGTATVTPDEIIRDGTTA